MRCKQREVILEESLACPRRGCMLFISSLRSNLMGSQHFGDQLSPRLPLDHGIKGEDQLKQETALKSPFLLQQFASVV